MDRGWKLAKLENAKALIEIQNSKKLPGTENRVPVAVVRDPPKLAYPPVPRTTEPAVVLREQERN